MKKTAEEITCEYYVSSADIELDFYVTGRYVNAFTEAHGEYTPGHLETLKVEFHGIDVTSGFTPEELNDIESDLLADNDKL